MAVLLVKDQANTSSCSFIMETLIFPKTTNLNQRQLLLFFNSLASHLAQPALVSSLFIEVVQKDKLNVTRWADLTE